MASSCSRARAIIAAEVDFRELGADVFEQERQILDLSQQRQIDFGGSLRLAHSIKSIGELESAPGVGRLQCSDIGQHGERFLLNGVALGGELMGVALVQIRHAQQELRGDVVQAGGTVEQFDRLLVLLADHVIQIQVLVTSEEVRGFLHGQAVGAQGVLDLPELQVDVAEAGVNFPARVAAGRGGQQKVPRFLRLFVLEQTPGDFEQQRFIVRIFRHGALEFLQGRFDFAVHFRHDPGRVMRVGAGDPGGVGRAG